MYNFAGMEEENIIYSSEMLVFLRECGDTEFCALMRMVLQAGFGLGYLFGSHDGDGFFRVLVERGFVLPLCSVRTFNGEEYAFEGTWIFNPEHVWKGEGWQRGVFDWEDGRAVFREPWLPVYTLLKEYRAYKGSV